MSALVSLIALTLVRALPIGFAALGGVLSERSGVINIALEGMLTASAFTAVLVSGATGNPLLGLIAAVIASAIVGLILGVAATRFKVDQIVAGTGLNIAILGAAAYGLVLAYGHPGASAQVPAFGTGTQSIFVVLLVVLAFALEWAIRATPWGLRVRAAGENPHALEAAGVDPRRVRVFAVTLGGAIAGLGGVFLAIVELNLYSNNMTAGRGFIALAAVIFGRWSPLGALAASLAFGFFSALEFVLQGSAIPSQVMQMLPYVAALVALAGFAGRARAPQADGIPY